MGPATAMSRGRIYGSVGGDRREGDLAASNSGRNGETIRSEPSPILRGSGVSWGSVARLMALPPRQRPANHRPMREHRRESAKRWRDRARPGLDAPAHRHSAATSKEVVAELYNAARAEGTREARQATADRLRLSSRTIDKYLKKARAAGLVPPYRPGK